MFKDTVRCDALGKEVSGFTVKNNANHDYVFEKKHLFSLIQKL